jgi:hypothetical protein
MVAPFQVPSILSVGLILLLVSFDAHRITSDNPYGATCYGLSQSAMVNWIRDFSNTYHSRTGR